MRSGLRTRADQMAQNAAQLKHLTQDAAQLGESAQFDELTVLSSGSAQVASREWKREPASFHGFNTAVANWVVRRYGGAYDTECNRKAYAVSLTIDTFICVCRSTSFIRLAGSTESFGWDVVKRNRTTVATT